MTADEISVAIESVVAQRPRRVAVDLARVPLLDSLGVRAVLSLWKRVVAYGGSVVLLHAHDQPLTVVKVLKLDELLASGHPANENVPFAGTPGAGAPG